MLLLSFASKNKLRLDRWYQSATWWEMRKHTALGTLLCARSEEQLIWVVHSQHLGNNILDRMMIHMLKQDRRKGYIDISGCFAEMGWLTKQYIFDQRRAPCFAQFSLIWCSDMFNCVAVSGGNWQMPQGNSLPLNMFKRFKRHLIIFVIITHFKQNTNI